MDREGGEMNSNLNAQTEQNTCVSVKTEKPRSVGRKFFFSQQIHLSLPSIFLLISISDFHSHVAGSFFTFPLNVVSVILLYLWHLNAPQMTPNNLQIYSVHMKLNKVSAHVWAPCKNNVCTKCDLVMFTPTDSILAHVRSLMEKLQFLWKSQRLKLTDTLLQYVTRRPANVIIFITK